jgi:hypothetical protein
MPKGKYGKKKGKSYQGSLCSDKKKIDKSDIGGNPKKYAKSAKAVDISY